MKKTIQINLGGLPFIIDEDAFEKLQKYLQKIKGYFDASTSREEIISDIESRIAEMFSTSIKSGTQIITTHDIDEVIKVMGKPEDFAEEAEMDRQEQEQGYSEEDSRSSRKRANRRIYRDLEGKKLGGVCSGFAYYLGIDPLWIRIIFVATTFIWGTSLFIYVLLWAIIPAAKTSAEKLEMKGEPVNIDNIGKQVEEEWKQFGKRATNIDPSGVETFARNLAYYLVKFFKIGLGIVFLLWGLGFLITILVAYLRDFSSFHMNVSGWQTYSDHLIEYLWIDSSNKTLGIVGFLITAGIPTLLLIAGGISMIFSIKWKSKSLWFSLAGIWVAGIVCLTIAGVEIASDFEQEATTTETEKLYNDSDTLALAYQIDKLKLLDYPKNPHPNKIFTKMDEGDLKVGFPKLMIDASKTEDFNLKLKKQTRGATYKAALDELDDLVYEYELTENTLYFDPYASTPSKKWRGQNIQLTLLIPMGKTIYLDENSQYLIYDIPNQQNVKDRQMVGHYWQMKTEGLTCLDCTEILADSPDEPEKSDEIKEEHTEISTIEKPTE